MHSVLRTRYSVLCILHRPSFGPHLSFCTSVAAIVVFVNDAAAIRCGKCDLRKRFPPLVLPVPKFPLPGGVVRRVTATTRGRNRNPKRQRGPHNGLASLTLRVANMRPVPPVRETIATPLYPIAWPDFKSAFGRKAVVGGCSAGLRVEMH